MSVIRHSSMLRVTLLAGLSIAGLSACHKSEAPQKQPEPAAAATAAPAPAVAPIAQTAPQATTPVIPVQIPAAVFMPHPNDVLAAFAQSLAGTVLKMPASPKRDAWYQDQVMVLKTLKVGGCTQSTAGTKSTCRVSLAGQEFDAHLLLTKEGWTLVE